MKPTTHAKRTIPTPTPTPIPTATGILELEDEPEVAGEFDFVGFSEAAVEAVVVGATISTVAVTYGMLKLYCRFLELEQQSSA